MTTTIDFYLDFISSFGYLARGRLLDIAWQYDRAIVYRPVDIKRSACVLVSIVNAQVAAVSQGKPS